MSDMYLSDFKCLAKEARGSICGFAHFRSHSSSIALGWPDEVLEQWIYDYADKASFLHDYGNLDLSRIRWDVEVLRLDELLTLPTGPSDAGCIEEFAADPDHWVRVRTGGVHMGISQCWEIHGTWKRWPILLDRELLDPAAKGL